MKRCAACKEEKLLEEFGVNGQSRDGRRSYCRPCYRAMHARYGHQKALEAGRLTAPRPARPPRPPGHKWCLDCRDYRPVEDFGKNRASKDGLNAYCRACHNSRVRESRRRVHGGSRHYHLLRRYGLSAADVEVMSRSQRGCCPICERELDSRAHVDHDHRTGQVRAILCFNCNGGLGQFGDDVERLERAAVYLERYVPGHAVEATMKRMLLGVRGGSLTATSRPRSGDPAVEYAVQHARSG